MPIYEYRCTACGNSVEVVHSINGTGPETCAVCGGAMRKALTTPAIVFKGSGWAKKDARSASKPAASGTAAKDGSGDGATGGSSDGETSTPSPDAGKKDATAPSSSDASSGTSGGSKGTSGGSTTAGSSPSSGAARAGSGDRSA
jgi:putative FmdB family regulatory protein